MARPLSRQLDRESVSALVKTLVFLVVTGGATFLLMNILANGLFRPSTQYKAVFDDVTNVSRGDDVRIAGVSVGSVEKIEIVNRHEALVTFGVDPDIALTTDTRMLLRYRNLVGQRYFTLTPGGGGPAKVLREGDTIPNAHTTDALDLTVLFQGFKPVFEALSPDDTNKLAFEIVQTLQGEGGTIKNLLGTTSSLTSTLADRDELIGQVVENLGATLKLIGDRDAELGDTIDTLQAFVGGLNSDRDAIFAAIDSISGLSTEAAALLQESRPQLVKDIAELRAATAAFGTAANLSGLEQDLQILPYKLRKLTAAASGASQFNFFICGLDGQLSLPGLPPIPFDLTSSLFPELGGPRCERGGN